MIKETFQQIKADLKELKKELDQMKDLVKEIESAVKPVNEGELTVEEVWAAIEPYRHLPAQAIEGYEKAREMYNTSRKLHDEMSERIRQLHDLIEAYEVRAEALGIPRSETEKLREWSNEISVQFGRYEGLLQYCAAAAVVFHDLLQKNNNQIKN